MFVDTGKFKKLIKKAYSTSGLTVGATEEEYFFEGGAWAIRILKENLPNKEKAAVVELAGDLPGTGEVFKAVKKEPNQYLIPENDRWDIGAAARKATETFNVTRAVYEMDGGIIRVLQHSSNNMCIPIDEVFISLIDIDALDKNTETMPQGPKTAKGGYIAYWQNNVMTLAAGIISEGEDNPLADYLHLLTNSELQKKEMVY